MAMLDEAERNLVNLLRSDSREREHARYGKRTNQKVTTRSDIEDYGEEAYNYRR